MKKLIATTLASMLLGVVAYSQGTVNFANAGAGFAAPIYMGDGSTLLSGATFQAVLFAGADQASMIQVGNATGFLTGGGAGYFNGGVITISTIAPGATGWFQVFAWDSTLGGTATGATLAQAMGAGMPDVWGESLPFQNLTGGPTPTPPTTLTGLQSFNLVVPEPSSLALVGLGGAALAFFRRRK